MVGALLGLSLAATSPASAFEHDLSVSATSAVAGEHPTISLAAAFPGAPGVRDLRLTLPDGLSIAPAAVKYPCTLAAADSGACGQAARIGSVDLQSANLGAAQGELYLTDPPQPGDSAGVAVSAEFAGGDAVLFAGSLRFVLGQFGQGVQQLAFAAIPLVSASGSPLALSAATLQIDGLRSVDGTALVTNPSTCPEDPAMVSSLAEAHDDEVAAASATYAVTGCEEIPFDAVSDWVFASPAAGQPTSAEFEIDVPLERSSVRNMHLYLPRAVWLNAPAIGGPDEMCPPSSINYGDVAVFESSSCPAQAEIGSIQLTTPLLQAPIEGAIYVVDESPLFSLAIEFDGFEGLMNTGLAPSWPKVIATCNPLMPGGCATQMLLAFDSLPHMPLTRLRVLLGKSGRVSSTGSPMPSSILRITSPTSPDCISPGASKTVLTPWARETTVTINDAVSFSGCQGAGMAPETEITSPSDGAETGATPEFEFTSTTASASFKCKLDGEAYVDCTSPYEFEQPLEGGEHRIRVRAVAGSLIDPTPAEATFVVDDEAPAQPEITTTPANPTSSRATEFAFSGEQEGQFECRHDGGNFSNCSSPLDLGELEFGSHTFEVRQTDRVGNVGAAAAFSWSILQSNDPTPIDQSGFDSFADQTKFIYEGEDAQQQGLVPTSLAPKRIAVVRGLVRSREASVLSGVRVTVDGHPEFGESYTDERGEYSMVVNGGGIVRMKYEKNGYLSAKREADTKWHDYAWCEDAALVPQAAQSDLIDLSNPLAPAQVAQGPLESDADGSRRATLIFNRGTQATMTVPGVGELPLAAMNVRASEYTVGANGPDAMPYSLPATTDYTYAIEYSVDEAVQAGATGVRFSQPVVTYTENFLGFPVGTNVPSGYYDASKGSWVADPNGKVVKVLSVSGGSASISVESSGNPATQAQLDQLGVSQDELARVADTLLPGESYWRVPVSHFSAHANEYPALYQPKDFNWNAQIPADASTEGGAASKPKDDGCRQAGSIIGCEDGSIGERIPIVGSDLALNYTSRRLRDSHENRRIDLSLSGATISSKLRGFFVRAVVGGQRIERALEPSANASLSIDWDGRDAFGRLLQGSKIAEVKIAYEYDAEYSDVPRFAAPSRVSANAQPFIVSARSTIALQKRLSLRMGTFNPSDVGLGGWMLDAEHHFDVESGTIYSGDGSQRSAQTVGNTIQSLNRSIFLSNCPPALHGFPIAQTWVCNALSAATKSDGSIVIGDGGGGNVRPDIGSFAIDGLSKSFAQAVALAGFSRYGGTPNPNYPFCGQSRTANSPAITLRDPVKAAVGPDDSILALDTTACILWRQSPSGAFSRVAGGGPAPFTANDVPATDIRFSSLVSVDADDYGNIYLSDLTSIYRVSPDGLVARIAGTSTAGHTPDGAVASESQIRPASGLAVGSDGTVYFQETTSNSAGWWIRSVTPDGLLKTEVGDGQPATACAPVGKSGPMTRLTGGTELSIMRDGSLLFGDCAGVRRLTPEGTVVAVAGSPTALPGVVGIGDGGNPKRAVITPGGVTPGGFAELPDGSIAIAGSAAWGMYATSPPLRLVRTVPSKFGTSAETYVPSEDGSELYAFDAEGRQLQTFESATGQLKLTFHRDSAGRLTRVIDGHGNQTRINHDQDGNPTSIESPYGQVTTLDVDSAGRLSEVTDPLQRTTTMTYRSDGRVASFTKPGQSTAHMTYDSAGRVSLDTDGGGGFKSLEFGHEFLRPNSAPDPSDVSRSSVTTAGGVRTDYRVTNEPTGDYTREVIRSGGLRTLTKHSADGSTDQELPDGTTVAKVFGPDPIFQMQAPIATQTKVTTPAGRNFVSTHARSATSSNPSDPLSVTATTDTFAVNGKTTIQQYTKSNRTYVTTSPAGRQSSTQVNQQGDPLSVTAGGLAATSIAYDNRGRPTQMAQGTRLTALGYDSLGRLSTTTDPLGRVTTFEYDDAGQLLAENLPGGRRVEYAYDDSGNLLGVMPPGRPQHGFTYNLRDLVTGASAPSIGGGPAQTSYAYNADKQLTEVTRPSGDEIEIEYDQAGRQSAAISSDGTTDFDYDAQTGNLASIDGPFGAGVSLSYDGSLPTGMVQSGPVSGSATLQYNNDFQVSGITAAGSTSSYSYDADGLLISAGPLSLERRADNGLLSGSSVGAVTQQLSYNTYGEPIQDQTSLPGGTQFKAEYQRDAAGRITQMIETMPAGARTFDYEYNDAGNLESVTKDGSVLASYTYDDNGNRLTATTGSGPSAETTTSTYNARDQLIQSGSLYFDYNENGELTSKTDDDTADHTTYSYSASGDLTGAELPDGKEITYILDPLGRRVGKKVDGNLVQGFLYAPGIQGPVAELDGAGAVRQTFIYATRSNVPDLVRRGSNTYRVITDHLGSPRMIVNSATGDVAQQITYDAFGKVTEDTSPGFTPFGFAGGLYDNDTGLTHFGAREYDAGMGRWTAADPISFAGGDSNLYGYVLGDPVNLVDPSGLYGVGDAWSDATGTVGEIPNTLKWWGRQAIENPATTAAVVAGAVCVALSAGACAAALAAQAAIGVGSAARDAIGRPECWRSSLVSGAVAVFPLGLSKGFVQVGSQMITAEVLRNEFARAGVRAYLAIPWVGTVWAGENIECAC